jgi:hypothetical protein
MHLSHAEIRELITLLRENMFIMRCGNQPPRERDEAIRLTKRKIEQLMEHIK